MSIFGFSWNNLFVIALGGMLLFFAGCVFFIGIWTTILFFKKQFPGIAVALFWIGFAIAVIIGYVEEVTTAVSMYTLSAPVFAVVLWYYERKQRRKMPSEEFETIEH